MTCLAYVDEPAANTVPSAAVAANYVNEADPDTVRNIVSFTCGIFFFNGYD